MIRIRFFVILSVYVIQLLFAIEANAITNAYNDSTYTPSYSDFAHEGLHGLSQDPQFIKDVNSDEISDPLEFLNKIMFDLNMLVDSAFGEPIVNSYRIILPEKPRRHVTYFFRNVTVPLTLINDLLQLDVRGAKTSFWRFFINTFLGFGGIVDLASDLGIDNHKNDFDLTLAHYKVPTGPYLVLPIFGPSSLRGLPAKFVDLHIDPIYAKFGPTWRKDIKYPRILNSRSENNEVIDAIKKSIDPYTAMKSLYMQNKINQGGK